MNEEFLVRNLIEEAREKIQEQISGLLGRTLTLEKPRIQQVSKEAFFTEPKRKLVLTRVAVKGDLEEECFIFIPLRDAILLGGTLIMLPPVELDSRIRKEEFGEEENDAFGEIANILTGVINTLFEENYPKKLRFIKTALQPLNTSKIDPAASVPFPPQNFLHGSYAMKMEEQSLGTLDVLFPEILFASTETVVPPPPPKVQNELPLVLMLADKGCDTETLFTALRTSAFEPTRLGFQDDAREFLQGKEVSGIFLVMREVTEQGFAAGIRVRSVLGNGPPLIAMAPQWTRNTVLKAVKFGIRDILVTPATSEEIQEKIVSYLLPRKT